MSLKSGHKIDAIPETHKKFAPLFSGRAKTVQLKPGGFCTFEAFEKFGNQYHDFQLYDDDVFVHTFPKSGTTWTQEIAWTMRNNPSLDSQAGQTPLAARTPTLEGDWVIDHLHQPQSLKDAIADKYPNATETVGVFLEACKALPRPRTMKTHLFLDLLPPNVLEKSKIVYVIRDPRDVCLSYHHHCRVFEYEKFSGTLDQFIDIFIEGNVIWGPYWEHVRQAWAKKDHPNVHITYYEEFKRNTKEEYKKLAKFLGKSLTEEQLDKVIHHTSFAEMKKRDDHVLPSNDVVSFMDLDKVKAEGGFFRKGTSGGWQKVLNQEQKDKFDAWIKANCPDPEIMRKITGE